MPSGLARKVRQQLGSFSQRAGRYWRKRMALMPLVDLSRLTTISVCGWLSVFLAVH
jgi:hypothetical protein